jgi:hypothetical protein
MMIIVFKDVAPVYSGRCLPELQAKTMFPFLGKKNVVKMKAASTSENPINFR